MWVRGLKPLLRLEEFQDNGVAPYVGAWIETYTWQSELVIKTGRTLCGCVD